MQNFNFFIYLNTNSDANSSNNPSLSNFKWSRNLNSILVNDSESLSFSLAPGETKSIFSGVRTLAQDNTTQYSISLVPGTSNIYKLAWSGGTAPAFRTKRSPGADATTAVNVTQNGPLLTFSSAPSTFASFSGQVAGMTTNIVITADNAGSGGNSVALTFDGSTSINAAISAWNIANPSNTITLTSGDGSQIPNNLEEIDLSGGITRTQFNLISGGVQVGDQVLVGNLFNPMNQGIWKILAVSSTSFTIENEVGAVEGPITLGSGFASQIDIFSMAGVQAGDTLVISGGFSLVSQGSYQVVLVTDGYIQFYSTASLPQESNIMTQAVAIYSAAKQLIYLETDQPVNALLNGSVNNKIEPFVVSNSVQPGMLLLKSTTYSLSVTNNGTNTANLFFAGVE